MKNTNILVTDQKVSSMKDLLPLLEQLLNSWTKDLIIIADDIEWEALTTIILNKLKWILNILWIKSPWFGDKKKEMLKDIAVLTWANLITSDLGMKLTDVNLDDLWSAKTVISSKDKTTIIGWEWEKQDIENRITEIKKIMEITESSYDREKLQERLARLDWWVAVIKVWAASEVEMKEKKLRIEDALNATRAAVEEWVVAWGWVALLKASKVLEWLSFWNEDQDIGAEIVRKSLYYPIRQISENAWKEWSVIVNKVLESNDINFWYNASNDTFVNMIDVWIIDPKKVERVAMEEAISLAWMFLTTEVAVVPVPSKTEEMPNYGGMWWMWGMPMM
jgi:chaperonin GroEL